MKIESCNCFEEKRKALENYYSPFSTNKLFIMKDKNGYFDVGVDEYAADNYLGSLIIVSHVKECPFCGKKIEVEG